MPHPVTAFALTFLVTGFFLPARAEVLWSDPASRVIHATPVGTDVHNRIIQEEGIRPGHVEAGEEFIRTVRVRPTSGSSSGFKCGYRMEEEINNQEIK